MPVVSGSSFGMDYPVWLRTHVRGLELTIHGMGEGIPSKPNGKSPTKPAVLHHRRR